MAKRCNSPRDTENHRQLFGEQLEDRCMLSGMPELVVDLSPNTNTNSSFPYQLTTVGDTVYFSADDGIHGSSLWKTDGTEEGTVLLKDIEPGWVAVDDVGRIDYGRSIVRVGDRVFFAAKGEDPFNDPWGYHLWTSDGSEEGTLKLTGLTQRGYESSFLYINIPLVTAVDNSVFFFVANQETGVEVWKSDNSVEGTERVKVLSTNTGRWRAYNPHPTGVDGDKFFFKFDDGANGEKLWISDGTEEGTSIVEEVHLQEVLANLDDLTNGGAETLYFFFAGRVWKSDGTEQGTVRVDLPAENQPPFTPDLFRIGDVDLFVRHDPLHGRELWKTDGTEAGTVLLKDIEPGSEGSDPKYLTVVGDVLIFQVDPEGRPYELWKSDGTEEGTEKLKELWITPIISRDIAVAGGKMIFASDDSVHGLELWVSDGTTEGTHLLKDINVQETIFSSGIQNLIEDDGKLYFTAQSEQGILWQSDGTAEGTKTLLLPPPEYFWDADEIVNVGDLIYFRGTNLLYKSDGTLEGQP